ncbi:MAG: hypothetical protein JWP97_3767 [Labilithrix sp.]|nr:hypothetical protein [Labilithrix sp.]
MCPRCRQNAPIVYRGVNAFCTACGAPRGVLASPSVNLAGQPSKVGGQVTRVFGWITLIVGSLVAAGLFAACSAVIGTSAAAAPFIASVPVAVIAWVLSYFMLKGGKSLAKSGEDQQKATRRQAVFMLANTRAGNVSPADLAQAIGVTAEEADDILTAMAKETPEHVSIEVDDNGTIFYRFTAAAWGAVAANPASYAQAPLPVPVQQRPMAPNASSSARSGYGAAPPITTRVADDAGRAVRVEPRDPVDDEYAPEPEAAGRRNAR